MYKFLSDIQEIADLRWTKSQGKRPITVSKCVRVNNTVVVLSSKGILHVMTENASRGRFRKEVDLRVRKQGSRSFLGRRKWQGWVLDLLEAAVLLEVLSQEALADFNTRVNSMQERNYRRFRARDSIKDLEEIGIKPPAKLVKLASEEDEETEIDRD